MCRIREHTQIVFESAAGRPSQGPEQLGAIFYRHLSQPGEVDRLFHLTDAASVMSVFTSPASTVVILRETMMTELHYHVPMRNTAPVETRSTLCG